LLVFCGPGTVSRRANYFGGFRATLGIVTTWLATGGGNWKEVTGRSRRRRGPLRGLPGTFDDGGA